MDIYGWLKPGGMLDGLGMAGTTPARSSWWCSSWASSALTAIRGSLPPLLAAAPGRHPRRAAHNVGDLRTVLPVDLHRRALCGDPAQQHRAQSTALAAITAVSRFHLGGLLGAGASRWGSGRHEAASYCTERTGMARPQTCCCDPVECRELAYMRGTAPGAVGHGNSGRWRTADAP